MLAVVPSLPHIGRSGGTDARHGNALEQVGRDHRACRIVGQLGPEARIAEGGAERVQRLPYRIVQVGGAAAQRPVQLPIPGTSERT